MKKFEIEIDSEQDFIDIDPDLIKKTLRRIFRGEGVKTANMEISIVDDPTIHDLNVRYLGHDYATDVLAFDMDSDLDQGHLEGNIIVSAQTARDRSSEFDFSPERELLLYIVHGTLHLLGYDDHAKEDAPLMRQKEKEYLPE
ncbi:MAG: rRNA maturation RNase YbeY [Planctomycetia bacterium]|nr:rRNA maturation RNase YbeY [Planctomycetia bacterium]